MLGHAIRAGPGRQCNFVVPLSRGVQRERTPARVRNLFLPSSEHSLRNRNLWQIVEALIKPIDCGPHLARATRYTPCFAYKKGAILGVFDSEPIQRQPIHHRRI